MYSPFLYLNLIKRGGRETHLGFGSEDIPHKRVSCFRAMVLSRFFGLVGEVVVDIDVDVEV